MVDGMRIGFNTASSRRPLLGTVRRPTTEGPEAETRIPQPRSRPLSDAPRSRERIQPQVGAAQPPCGFAAAQGETKRGPAKQRPRQPFGVAKVLRHVRADRDQRAGRGATAQAASAAPGVVSAAAVRPAAVTARSSAPLAAIPGTSVSVHDCLHSLSGPVTAHGGSLYCGQLAALERRQRVADADAVAHLVDGDVRGREDLVALGRRCR